MKNSKLSVPSRYDFTARRKRLVLSALKRKSKLEAELVEIKALVLALGGKS